MLRWQRNKEIIMIEALKKSKLFMDFSEQDIMDILPCLNYKRKEYEKGQFVLTEQSIIDDVGVVIKGHARSIKEDVTGKTVIVTLLEPGSYIGILLAASKKHRSPVSVQATTPLTVLFFPVNNIICKCPKLCKKHDILIQNFIDGIAEKALLLHDRNDCLIKQSVREKILTYLTRVSIEKGTKTFTIPFDRSGMADYLNVERSALSREISRMKKEGLIDYNKNHFSIID